MRGNDPRRPRGYNWPGFHPIHFFKKNLRERTSSGANETIWAGRTYTREPICAGSNTKLKKTGKKNHRLDIASCGLYEGKALNHNQGFNDQNNFRTGKKVKLKGFLVINPKDPGRGRVQEKKRIMLSHQSPKGGNIADIPAVFRQYPYGGKSPWSW